MVADIEELDTVDASEIRAQRLNAKEEMALKKKRGFNIYMPNGRGYSKIVLEEIMESENPV